ncbi:MAG: ABC transporter substrate-binding protein [Ruminococcaceae bacterium]|nr:ABC transporter substrate-binding protein [Oscillospiraceae bacterium]
MKKLVAILLTLALLVTAFAGCAAETTEEDVTIRIGGLKGPTSMGLVKVMEDDEAGTSLNDYEFTIAASADEVTPKLIQGELDIVAVPANLASVLYNNTEGAVQLLAINTLGVIYIVEKGESIQSVADLKGKTIYATGKGSTPEYALRYILAENGVNPDTDVTIEWKSEPTEVVATLNSTEDGVAMLPQPFVTVAQGSVEGLRVAIDLTEAWDALDNGSMLLTGVLLVRREFAEAHPQALADFLEEYEASTTFVNENPADASVIIEKVGIVKAAVAEKAIPYCNITFIAGDDMKAPMDGYLAVLFEQNPKSVGGTLPDEDFYYAE